MNENLFLKDGEYIQFRGKPLVRDKNVICYGDMEKDPYVLLLMVISEQEISLEDGTKEKVPGKIMGQIYASDASLDAAKRVQKVFSANGLYEAFDYGLDYLERENRKASKA